MSETKKKGWPELGIITKNPVRKRDADGNFAKDANGKFINVTDDNGNVVYSLGFKLAENVTVLVDGQPVALSKSRYGKMVTPVQEVEGLYKYGQIGDDKIEARRQSAREAHNWLRYKIQLPPPRD